MPELSRVVVLRGIQRGVDWRPTQLADHLPSALRACSLCGGVEPMTTTLPCSHAFCDNCLRASKAESDDGEQLCVLDGRPFVGEEHIIRKKCSTKDAASIKVVCWNSCYGCDFIGPVSQLPEHFEVDCKFHPAVCPRCKDARGSIRAELLPSAMYSVPLARHGLRRQTTQLTHYVPDQECADREKKAFLALFRRRKAASSGSASDFMPFYDLLKRGIELSVPETWTAKVALDGNRDCHVKIVILEENSALDVYAKVEERRKTFNPWKVESVRLVHPSESALLSHSSGSHPLKPTWTHSRAARLKFPASGYGFHGSHRFEAMCRRGFVQENDTVTFCVTLIRKWNAPTESTAAEGT
ncbi:hypothetical protein MTO96_050582 [Rhipicephalus appendiculatus]